MILSITLNPALDVSGMVEELVPNEKSYVYDEKRLPGGNGINSARIAHRLGSEVLTTGFLGGASGEEICQHLKSENIPQNFIKIKGRTRTNVTISLEKTHQQTRLSFPGPSIQKKEISGLLYLLERSNPVLVLIGGSLPHGVSSPLLKKILQIFKDKEVPVFLDVPGKILKDSANFGAFFIKPNLVEFQEMIGKKVQKIDEVVREARKLTSSIPLVCISSVEGGALLVTEDSVWFGKIPKVKIQSTVGAGDSMVGAMAHTFVKGHYKLTGINCEKMLRTGLAASCATLVNSGLTMGSKAAIKSYYPKIMIKEIS